MLSSTMQSHLDDAIAQPDADISELTPVLGRFLSPAPSSSPAELVGTNNTGFVFSRKRLRTDERSANPAGFLLTNNTAGSMADADLPFSEMVSLNLANVRPNSSTTTWPFTKRSTSSLRAADWSPMADRCVVAPTHSSPTTLSVLWLLATVGHTRTSANKSSSKSTDARSAFSMTGVS